jgi:hypothetical protein
MISAFVRQKDRQQINTRIVALLSKPTYLQMLEIPSRSLLKFACLGTVYWGAQKCSLAHEAVEVTPHKMGFCTVVQSLWKDVSVKKHGRIRRTWYAPYTESFGYSWHNNRFMLLDVFCHTWNLLDGILNRSVCVNNNV